MKRDEYFQIMDGVSEENITEMMQYHRSRRTPAHKEKTMITQNNPNDDFTTQNGKEISITKRRSYTAAAVAAALFALNIGVGFMLLNSRNQTPTSSPAGCSMDADSSAETTEAVLEQSTDVSTMVTEQTAEATATIPREDQPQYVQLMQMYYEDMTDKPCYYDFTGLGKDYDASWENEDFKITLRAVTGCDWILYYFYDVEAKQGLQAADFWANPHLAANMWNADWGSYMIDVAYGFGSFGSESTPDGDVVHCSGTIYNTTGRPFFHQDDEQSRQMQFVVHIGEEKYDLTQIQLDFVEQEFPLHDTEQPSYISKFTEYGFLGIYGINEWVQERTSAPLNHCAETPFGIYYLSDHFENTGSWSGTNSRGLCCVDSLFDDEIPEENRVIDRGAKPGILSYTAYLQKNAEGETVKSLQFSHDTYCCSYCPDDSTKQTISCLYAMFDQPVDYQEGDVVLAETE